MERKEIYDLPELFEAVQLNSILEDGKTFVDCIPTSDVEEIGSKYLQQKGKEGFDLKTFVQDNFEMPPVFGSSYKSKTELSVEEKY